MEALKFELSPEVLIRPAQKSDLAQVLVVDQESFSAGGGYNFLTLRQILDAGPEFFLLAEVEGKTVGYIAALPASTPGQIWIISVAVSPSARKTHVAKRLCYEIYQVLVRHGFHEVFLTVRPENQPILRIAKAFQMQLVREEPDYFGPGEARLVLSCKI